MNEQSWLRAALQEPPFPGGGVEGMGARVRARVARRRRGGLALLLAASTAGALLVLPRMSASDEPDLLAGPSGAGQGRWEVLPPAPLSPRREAAVVAVGDDVLVLGGTTQPRCPGNANCIGPSPRDQLRDAAAFNTSSRMWRRISRLPVAQLHPSAVVDDVAYALDSGALRAYDVSEDRWRVLPGLPQEGRSLISAGRVLLSAVSDGAAPDMVFDPSVATWSALPTSPLGAGSGRRFLWTGREAVLVDTHVVAEPGPGQGGAVTRYVTLDLRDRTWGQVQTLPPLPLGLEAVGPRLVAMSFQGAGPGPRDASGNLSGGFIDLETAKLTPLPDDRPEPAATVHGGGGWPADGHDGTKRYLAAGAGVFLDTRTDRWLSYSAPPPEVGQASSSTWIRGQLFVWGGSAPRPGDMGLASEQLIASGATWTP